jgi:hypothetical protein
MNCRAGARRSQGFGVPDFTFETVSFCLCCWCCRLLAGGDQRVVVRLDGLVELFVRVHEAELLVFSA